MSQLLMHGSSSCSLARPAVGRACLVGDWILQSPAPPDAGGIIRTRTISPIFIAYHALPILIGAAVLRLLMLEQLKRRVIRR